MLLLVLLLVRCRLCCRSTTSTAAHGADSGGAMFVSQGDVGAWRLVPLPSRPTALSLRPRRRHAHKDPPPPALSSRRVCEFLK